MPIAPLHSNSAVAAPQPQSGPAAPVPPALAPLPNPKETLRASEQRFPGVDKSHLTGKLAYGERPTVSDAVVAQIPNMSFQTGVSPIVVGDSNAAKIVLMPNRGVAKPNVAEKIQQHVVNGREVFGRIMSGAYTGQPNKADATALMWYLQALGSSKAAESSGGSGMAVYKEGGMFIEDPDGRLQDFLTRANSYERSSSHMREYQALGDEFSSRGVDIRNTETPNNRKTILFARMPMDNEAQPHGLKGTGNKRMLFVKMEPHGCRGLTTQGGVTPRAPGGGPLMVWKGVKRFFANAKDLFMHGTGFLRSAGQRMGLVSIDGQNNRERIPSDLKKSYTAVLDFLEQSPLDGDAQATRQLLDILNRGNPRGDSSGIKTMLDNVRDAAAHVTNNLTPGPGSQQLLSSLRGFERTLDKRGDHPDMRIGHEVIIMRDEAFTDISPTKEYKGEGPLSGGAVLDPDAMKVVLAGYQYQIDNIDNANRVDIFEKDTNRSTYTIGASGNEASFTQDTYGAWQAVTALTDYDSRVAGVLMSFANQSLPSDISARMANDFFANAGCIVPFGVQGDTRYGISRMPDNAQGEAVYVVSYEADTKPESFPLNSGETLMPDPNASSIKTQVKVQITVHANRSMTPEFVLPPSYSYTFTPKQSS